VVIDMAGTSSRNSGCTTSVRRSRRNPKAEQQQQHDQQRRDDQFEALKQRIQEVSNG